MPIRLTFRRPPVAEPGAEPAAGNALDNALDPAMDPTAGAAGPAPTGPTRTARARRTARRTAAPGTGRTPGTGTAPRGGLVLHVGTHKTGTSAIQAAFAHNSARLAEAGLVWPRIGVAPGHHALLADWVAMPPPYRLPGGTGPVWQGLAAQLAAGDRVMLSSEKFCCGRPVARVDLRDLRAKLGNPARAEVICVLRDQKSLIQSFYFETARHRMPQPFAGFLGTALKQGYLGNLWLDYNALYDHLLTAFAPEEIRFIPYSDLTGHPEGAVGWMLAHLGLGLGLADLDPVPPEAGNVSPGALAFLLAHGVSQPDYPDPELLALAAARLRQRLGDDRPGTLFTEEEETRVRRQLRESNRRFEARVRQVDPDFRMPRLRKPQPDVPRRTLLDKALWLDFSRDLHNAPLTAGPPSGAAPEPGR